MFQCVTNCQNLLLLNYFRTTVELKDVRNLEKMIKNHDAHISRNLHQTMSNLKIINEKIPKKDQNQPENYNNEQITEYLNTLLPIIQESNDVNKQNMVR